ncbi:hypothetical protein [Pedobacter punctiformis]|uniref:VOC domain-containing protein n=1 Tax=Pedobacter punctiformis TaxID=3004097 RepID=A0ABT4LD25_9SPHI|nr:hypothetical protein [Pedobacter sp. HCMS5-2]MCZ4245815.1 hypothetical protein [Pedobacter sp. HCMS5-2]
MIPIIDHIQITVQDLKIAELFYDQLMPILGFDINRKSKESYYALFFKDLEGIKYEIIFEKR